MAKDNTDFLRFSAFSIKDLITKKLTADGKFSDQVYEGSNLAILIDLVSYMFQCLVYHLNNAAAESMFTDTQIYDNIQRLVQLLGYNPRGCIPSQFGVTVVADSKDSAQPAKFDFIDTGLTDSNAKKIYFSVCDMQADDVNTSEGQVTLVNGKWKLYSQVFTASGTENETFVLDGLQSDSADGKYVSQKHVQVIVTDQNGVKYGEWFNDVDGIFVFSSRTVMDEQGQLNNMTNLYGKDSYVYSYYLNQNKTYELKFGDGVTGRKLTTGDRVYVFYLDTNGPDGKIDLHDIDFTKVKFKNSAAEFGMSEDYYKYFFGITLSADPSESGISYEVTNASTTPTSFVAEEGVEEIRQNAPNWFKVGNRLVTPSDYEYYVKNVIRSLPIGGEVVDIKCMSNTQFVSQFYKWLYMCGRQYHGNGRHYFKDEFWIRTGYRYVDPADCNNLYLFIKFDGEQPKQTAVDTVTNWLQNQMNYVKTMTSEIIFQNPVITYFDICANSNTDDVKRRYLSDKYATFDQDFENYIEITLDDDTAFTTNAVQQKVYDIIKGVFDAKNCKLGQNVDFSQALNRIYQIPGVQNVQTVFGDPQSGQIFSKTGLSFASWSDVLTGYSQGDELEYDDLEVGNVSRQLKSFQFPQFYDLNTLMRRIKLIKKILTSVNTITN